MLTFLSFLLACFCEGLCIHLALVHVHISNDVSSYKCLAASCEVRDLLILGLSSSSWDRLDQSNVIQVKVQLFIHLLQVAFHLDSVLQLDVHSDWDLFALFSK